MRHKMTQNLNQEPPIKMELHFFEEAQVKPNPNFVPQTEQAVTFQTTIWSSVYENPSDHSKFVLKMRINLPYPKQAAVPIIASFVAVGVFSVKEDYAEKKEEKALLVKATGGGMLYGAAREFILQMTARCNWDNRPLYLPTFSLAAITNAPLIEVFTGQFKNEDIDTGNLIP